MSRPLLEVADLIRSAGTAFIERNRKWIRWTHIKVLLASIPPAADFGWHRRRASVQSNR